MHSYSKLSLLALASLASVASAFPHPNPAYVNGKAIYVTSNAPQNAVVAIPIAESGSLLVEYGSSTATGGEGENGITAASGMPAGPDSLFSQSAVTIAGRFVFAVNAGSNTVSMMAIDRRDATKLYVVGSPAAVPGEFPNTVAASHKFKIVCVGMTGAKAGVSCAPYSEAGIGAFDEMRPFELGQTTPPRGPFNTVSQVFFSGDEKTLYVTVKGDPTTTTNKGFFAAFPVQNARPSCYAAVTVASTGVTSSPSGTVVLFGSNVIADSTDLFVTDPSFGAAILSVDGSGKASTADRGVIAGQAATCWATVNPATNTGFVADAGLDRLVEVSLTDASVIGAPINLTAISNGDPGLTDLRSAGKFVYALSPGKGATEPSVVVVNAVSREPVQHVSVASLGLTKSAQGMAILV